MTAVATPIDYLAIHAQAIKDREAATTSGAKAHASKRIGLAELELSLLGVDYTPYAPPSASGAGLSDLTPMRRSRRLTSRP
jgi:hypothetical protein